LAHVKIEFFRLIPHIEQPSFRRDTGHAMSLPRDRIKLNFHRSLCMSEGMGVLWVEGVSPRQHDVTGFTRGISDSQLRAVRISSPSG